MRTVGGSDDVSLLERAADSDGDRLLTDRDVQEAGQLAGAKALFDLLLEPSNQQHLAEELAQIRVRERPFLLHLRHGRQCTLQPLQLVADFNEIERGIPDDWSELRLALTDVDPTHLDRAAALLGPANPGRFGNQLRFSVVHHGLGAGPESVRRLLKRLDDEGIRGKVELLDVEQAPTATPLRKDSLRAQWENALETLPPDWSDVYAQVRLDSSDYIERGALLLAPVNPSRAGAVATFRFRSARRFGYGVAPQMAARCFERCDAEGITGAVGVLYALSDTHPVATQGPVWIQDSRVV